MKQKNKESVTKDRPTVIVRAELTPSALNKLERVTSPHLAPDADAKELVQEIKGYDALICHGPERFYTEELFQATSRLKILARTSVGTDMVDIEAATRHGVMVTNTPGTNSLSVAEQGILLILAVSRKLVECDKMVRSCEPFRQTDIYNRLQGQEISGKKLGIVGFGAVGTQLARLGLAMGLEVSAHDPKLDADTIRSRGATPLSLEDILREADYLVLSCPLNEETRGMINHARLAMMKPDAYLINIARAGLVVTEDLVDALNTKTIAGAAIDVTDPEPPLENDPLLAMGNVIFSAHQGGNTKECWNRMCQAAVDNVLDFFNGARPRNLVNPEGFESTDMG